MTVRLYEQDPMLRRFSAVVKSCEKRKDLYAVELDQTAFYPEGGGQAGDAGTLDGIPVRDTISDEGRILHLCASPIEPGKTVEGVLDWEPRFLRMQAHSGEHIVSGLIHGKFGYDNIGFHMGADCMTVDFSGKLTEEDLAELQKRANALVTADVPVRCWYPDEETLKTLSYRSKKELPPPVRLVEIPGADLCACCGTHVVTTGQIGPILILSREGLGKGTRLQMICGGRAQEEIGSMLSQNRRMMALFSAKSREVADGAARMAAELNGAKARITRLCRENTALTAQLWQNKGNALLFREELEGAEVGKLALAVAEVCGGCCAVCVPAGGGFRLAVAGRDAQTLGKALTGLLSGSGGGRELLFQGSVRGTKDAVEAAWKQVTA